MYSALLSASHACGPFTCLNPKYCHTSSRWHTITGSLSSFARGMALEDEFGIEIPDEEAEKITTVQLAIDYALAHQKA